MADAPKDAAERAGRAIDGALAFIAAGSKPISATETKATKPSSRNTDDGRHRKTWGALTAMIKLNNKVNRQSAAMKAQQTRIKDLTGRVIQLETQLEMLMQAGSIRRLKG